MNFYLLWLIEKKNTSFKRPRYEQGLIGVAACEEGGRGKSAWLTFCMTDKNSGVSP